MSRLSEAAFQLAYFFLRLGVPAILHSDDGSLVDYWAEGCVALQGSVERASGEDIREEHVSGLACCQQLIWLDDRHQVRKISEKFCSPIWNKLHPIFYHVQFWSKNWHYVNLWQNTNYTQKTTRHSQLYGVDKWSPKQLNACVVSLGLPLMFTNPNSCGKNSRPSLRLETYT